MNNIQPVANRVFEISWEVCNKVGGIYTVISSKAGLMKEFYNNYITIGPYIKEKAQYELKKQNPPGELRKVFEELKKEGINCYYGAWQIKGEPTAILIDFYSLKNKINELKKWFWENYKIDSLKSGWDFEEPMIFCWAAGKLLEKLGQVYNKEKVVAHCHEWMAGFIILYLKSHGSNVKTVFTTHATMLGRAMAGNGKPLYEMLDKMNPEKEAYEVKVQGKWSAERAMAKATDIFTTVSEITGIEAEKILGRKPEVLVLNGLDIEKFPTIEETSIKHVTARERLREFITYYFFPYYHNFDLKHNLMFFISGRYEYQNKGLDIFIEALAKLNKKLQEENSQRTITVFFWVPMGIKGIKTELMENQSYYRHIKNYIEWNSKDILKKIMYDFICMKDPTRKSIYTKEFMQAMKKDVLHFKRHGNPPMVTHNIESEEKDSIISTLVGLGLDNREDDKVKIIVNPAYLDGTDGLINLPIYDAMAGCHFGIFPSYYEPWGYTPLESAAMGVPALTTDLAGYGRFIKPQLLKENPGIYVISRYKKKRKTTVEELYQILYKFAKLDHAERVSNKLNAKEISILADWKHLVKNYIIAHNRAFGK
jgi:glycogen(starch) synthase